MIPVLYKEGETDFEHNGLGLLTDCISCIPNHKRNGDYILTMKYPVFGVRRDKIVGKSIIKAKADDIYDPQLFRVYSISKPSNGYITVKAEHISCELKDNFVESCTYEGNCIGALEALNNSAAFKTRFNFSSDITMTGKINLERKNLWDCIVGTSGSIIDTYGNGADIVRDNFNIAVKQNGGINRKVLIEYTKNLNNFKCSEDWSNCYTRIYPYVVNAENQEVFTLTDKYVDSEYISRDKNPRIIPIDFSQSYQNFSDVTEENLKAKAVAYFKNNKCDVPTLKYSLELIALSNTEEYKNAGLSEKVALFDTVIVRHKVYGIDTEIKVIEDKYNTLTEKHIKLVLNDSGSSVRSELANVTNTIVNDKIDSSLKNSASVEYVNQAISDLSAAITGCDGGYVRLNPETNPSEILVMDNEDINSAQVVWRWNKEGWGVSTNGYNGPFVGLAKDGKLVVNEATAYKMTAAMLNAGILKSVDGKCWFNLENSTFNYDDFISLTKNDDGTKTFRIKLNDGTYLDDKLSGVANQSDITASADQIKMSVGETGADNIILNSRADQNLNFWYGTVERGNGSTSLKLTNGTYFRIINTTTDKIRARTEVFALKPSTTYTLSCYLNCNELMTTNGISVEFHQDTDKSLIGTNAYSFTTSEIILTNYKNGWNKYVVTVTTNSDTVCGCLRFVHNGASNAGDDARVYWADVLLYEGVITDSEGNVISKPWCQHPTELYSTDMIIDKKGVLQRSNGVNSIGLSENSLNVYDFEGDDHIVGKYKAYRTTNKLNSTIRSAAALHSRYDDLLILGYLNSAGGLNEVMVFDSTKAYSGSMVSFFGDISIYDILTFKGTDGSYGGDILSDKSMLRIRANFDSNGKVVIGQAGSLSDNVMEITRQGLYHQGNINAGGDMSCVNMTVTGTLGVAGTKNRLVETSQGLVGVNAYETSEAFFGDVGESQIDENGICIILFEDLFLETVNTTVPYQVFLSKYGEGDIWCEERNEKYFVVKGTPGLKFSFEVKCKQKGYEDLRLKIMED